MKHIRLSSLLPVIGAGLLLSAPASSFAGGKVTVYRDKDGDGHYNKKTYQTHGGNYYYNNGRYYSGGRYYNGGSYYGRPYGYYGRPYPYYQPYFYGGPSVSITTYSRPVYSSSGPYYGDGLAVDVQRELRRRGYYRGSIDGDVGSGTRAAIRAYQDDRGLAVTGRIDRSLLRSLGIS